MFIDNKNHLRYTCLISNKWEKNSLSRNRFFPTFWHSRLFQLKFLEISEIKFSIRHPFLEAFVSKDLKEVTVRVRNSFMRCDNEHVLRRLSLLGMGVDGSMRSDSKMRSLREPPSLTTPLNIIILQKAWVVPCAQWDCKPSKSIFSCPTFST